MNEGFVVPNGQRDVTVISTPNTFATDTNSMAVVLTVPGFLPSGKQSCSAPPPISAAFVTF